MRAQRLHGVDARLPQILMPANLAPTMQEALLFLPRTVRGQDCVTENRLRRIARIANCETQKRLVRSSCASSALWRSGSEAVHALAVVFKQRISRPCFRRVREM